MKASARKTGRPLFAVVAEMNDPYRLWTPHPDSLDPFTRAAIWHSWGFGSIICTCRLRSRPGRVPSRR